MPYPFDSTVPPGVARGWDAALDWFHLHVGRRLDVRTGTPVECVCGGVRSDALTLAADGAVLGSVNEELPGVYVAEFAGFVVVIETPLLTGVHVVSGADDELTIVQAGVIVNFRAVPDDDDDDRADVPADRIGGAA